MLIAEDDPDDRLMIGEAWRENLLSNDLYFVEDGEELMDYLKHRGKYAHGIDAPRPGLRKRRRASSLFVSADDSGGWGGSTLHRLWAVFVFRSVYHHLVILEHPIIRKSMIFALPKQLRAAAAQSRPTLDLKLPDISIG